MLVTITEETSTEISNRINIISQNVASLKAYFDNRSYGDDLRNLYIGVICMSPKFEQFFKPRKPNYKREAEVFLDHGVQVEQEAMSLTYDLKLDYETYLNTPDIKPMLAQDILKSLDTISTIKKIKDFDLNKFKSDFELFFQQNGWL